MAAEANDPERADLALRSITAAVDDLPAVSAEWAGLSTDERISWSLDWGNEMAKLQQLAEAVVSARLDTVRTSCVHRLAERVVSQMDTLRRLDLRLPAEVVLALGRAPV